MRSSASVKSQPAPPRIWAACYPHSTSQKKRKRGEGRRDFLKIVVVVIAAFSLGVATFTSIRTEQREAERDMERRLAKIAVQLDELNRLVQATPLPPPGSGATDEEMRARLVP